jgi:hypothetical protein
MNYGIITSIDVEKQMGIVASCGMDGMDLHFFLDAEHPVKEGDSVVYELGNFANKVRLDKPAAVATVDSGGRKVEGLR